VAHAVPIPVAVWMGTRVRVISTLKIATDSTPTREMIVKAMTENTCTRLCCALTGQPIARIAPMLRKRGRKRNRPSIGLMRSPKKS
jgi:hypothetical protein